MTERRTLIAGLDETPPPMDAGKVKEFIYNTKPKPPTNKANRLTRINWTIRMREDFVKALKQASLRRQLDAIEPATVQDIIEQAIEPWLRDNGYLSHD